MTAGECHRVMTVMFLVFTAATSVSCSRSLLVSVEPKTPDGLPIRLPVPVRVMVTQEYAPAATCPLTQVERVLVLPLGERVYVNARRGFLTKSDFSVEFHENGALKRVGSAADPSSAVTAAKDALTTAIPLLLAKPSVAEREPGKDCVLVKETFGDFVILQVK